MIKASKSGLQHDRWLRSRQHWLADDTGAVCTGCLDQQLGWKNNPVCASPLTQITQSHMFVMSVSSHGVGADGNRPSITCMCLTSISVKILSRRHTAD